MLGIFRNRPPKDGPQAPPTDRKLVEQLYSARPPDRRKALEAIAPLRDPAYAAALEPRLSDPAEDIRIKAREALEAIGRSALESMLLHGEGAQRCACARILGRIGGSKRSPPSPGRWRILQPPSRTPPSRVSSGSAERRPPGRSPERPRGSPRAFA